MAARLKKKIKRKARPEEDPNRRIIESLIKLKLTDEDMRQLETEVTPVAGGPWELGWPHHRVLLSIDEPAERFWYEEKARNQALSLRELEKAVRENVFYKSIGRRPPKPRPLGPKRAAPKSGDSELENDPGYRKLLRDVRKVIDRAEAKGVAVRHRRDDILSCAGCGAFEDVLCGEDSRRTFLASGEETPEPFLVIDKKETHEYRKYGDRFITIYEHVCGVCGVHQSASLSCVFYDEKDEI